MPEALVVGVGCTRGTPSSVLAAGIDSVLARHALSRAAVCALASIDRKRDEPGLLALAVERGWAIKFYDAATLAAVVGAQPSDVALRAVGASAVAEPAARLGAACGPLRVPKTAFAADGHAITVAVAALRRRDG